MKHKPDVEQARAIRKRRGRWHKISATRLAAAKRLAGRPIRIRKSFHLPAPPNFSKPLAASTGIEIIKSVVRKLDPETAFFLGYGFAVAGQQLLKELESEARPDRPKK